MRIMTTEPAGGAHTALRPNGFRFQVADVTGTHVVDVQDLDRKTPVSAVAAALAARMELPRQTSWALRENRTGSYLDDQRAIGDQVETEARLTLSPRAHLG